MKEELTAPRARRDGLVVREVEGELLIYDLARDRAHCLNAASALVWKSCDGSNGAAELAEILRRETGTAACEEVVALALKQLGRRHLLEEGWGGGAVTRVSRRELLSKYLPVALTLPVVLSIAAPTAALAGASCIANGLSCTSDAQCCSNNCVITTGHGICSPLGTG